MAAVLDIEQQRRDLLRDNRELYNYIARRESAKALDALGDRLSGISHEAANIAWAESTAYKHRHIIDRLEAE